MMKSSNGSAYRVAVFGALNTGKSSLINALLGHGAGRASGGTVVQAEVSDLPGTTKQAVVYESDVQPLGRTAFVDTTGYHHGGKLGARWLDSADEVMSHAHVAMLVMDAGAGEPTTVEQQLLETLRQRGIPVIIAANKRDTLDASSLSDLSYRLEGAWTAVSCATGEGLEDLLELLRSHRPDVGPSLIAGDMVERGDIVIMVVPAAWKAPKGSLDALHARLFRELLDEGAMPMAVAESQLPQAITGLTRAPALIIAESGQLERLLVFLPPDIQVTTFAVFMARRQGNLNEFIQATRALATLRPGDRVLIAEGCSHRPLSEEDAQRALPDMLRTLVGGPLEIERCAGCALPSLDDYRLVVHCHACRLDRREMLHRQALGRRAGVPIVSLGFLQSYLAHALPRILQPLKERGLIQVEIDDLEPVQESRPVRLRSQQAGRVRRTVTLAV